MPGIAQNQIEKKMKKDKDRYLRGTFFAILEIDFELNWEIAIQR